MSRLLVAQRALTVPGWAKDALWRRAQAIPSLDLRFADSKSLVDAVTGASLITFTRASSGTFVGSDGLLQTAANDVPRFDHNPITGESLGLLPEEQRTNLLLRSEEFDNVSIWGVLNVTVSANTQVAPNGTTSAETITDVNGVTSANVACFQSIALADSTTYAMSCYVKAGTKTTCRVGIRDKTGANIVANFNLATASTTVGNALSSTIQNAGNGWYRCTAICASATGAISPRGLVFMDTGSYTADGTGTIHVWGAQLEAGAFPTSYIPTTTAAATRSADVASITGSAFSGWYRQDEGTMFVDVNSAPVNNIIQMSYDVSDGTVNERFFHRRTSGGTVQVALIDGGVTQGDIGGIPVAASARYKTGFAYKLNDLELLLNGGGSSTDTSATIPTVNQLYIGQSFAAGLPVNGTIRRLCYWPQRLSNQVLQAITQ